MNRFCTRTVLASLLAVSATVGADISPEVPSAIFTDPPADAHFPADSTAFQFESHGNLVNGLLYRPAGAGPHPIVILLHGLPGNEQNLDLAQVMRRAGWAVITFHYRGSWGSGGSFSLSGGKDDVNSLLKKLRQSPIAQDWRVDPNRIVLVGHSYGGFVAAQTAASDGSIMAVGLIAPWDISQDVARLAGLPKEERAKLGAKMFDDVDGRLHGADSRSLTEEIFAHGRQYSLAAFAPRLANRPLAIFTATRDDPDDQAIEFLKAIGDGSRKPTVVQFDSDHPFNDHRIALQAAVLRWLNSIPSGAR